MKAQGSDPVLPFNPAPHLTDWLIEIGPVGPGGEDAISFLEIEAWSRLTSMELDPWEARTLRRLSRAFLAQRREAKKPSCIEPRLRVDEVSARKRVDDQFAAMLAVFGRIEPPSKTATGAE